MNRNFVIIGIGVAVLAIAPFAKMILMQVFQIPTQLYMGQPTWYPFFVEYSIFVPGIIIIGIGVILTLRKRKITKINSSQES